MKQGKFIVIEGTDGSGKGTQTKLLSAELAAAGYQTATFDFPQYLKSSSDFIKNYLKGRYGGLGEVSPRKASLLFAVDRFEASDDIKKALSEGKIVIANRYVGSNLGHQGAKIDSPEERLRYFKWVEELEYHILGIPKPDISIILHVPAEIAQLLVDKKASENRAYAEGAKRDLHEENLNHLRRAESVYLELASLFPEQFTLIECVAVGRLLSVDEIAKKIWLVVEPVIKEATETKPLF